MAYYVDVKYLNIIASRLPLFKKKSQNLWNCRCILCGDSQTNKSKARGFFYMQHNRLLYKCHNCAAGMTLGSLLEQVDPALAEEYSLEKFKSRVEAKEQTPIDFDYAPRKVYEKNPLNVFPSVQSLPDDHEAKVYCRSRKIPDNRLKDIYFLEHTTDIAKITDKYPSIKNQEPRLLLPYYNPEGALVGCTLRGIRGESLRYISIKIVENETMIFGLKSLDTTKDIYVVEGAFDSMFLPNAIACGGMAFDKVQSIPNTTPEQFIFVFDNQPRNKELLKIMDKFVEHRRVCIWPANSKFKDINEMVKEGIDAEAIIKNRVFSGLTAQLHFSEWRKL